MYTCVEQETQTQSKSPIPESFTSCQGDGAGGVGSSREDKDTAMRKKPKKQKLTQEDYVARFNAEKAVMQRKYCDIFKFWRSCPLKSCRRAQACTGDQNACLKEGEQSIPRELQWQARQQILAATPANVGAPERLAREFLPGSF